MVLKEVSRLHSKKSVWQKIFTIIQYRITNIEATVKAVMEHGTVTKTDFL